MISARGLQPKKRESRRLSRLSPSLKDWPAGTVPGPTVRRAGRVGRNCAAGSRPAIDLRAKTEAARSARGGGRKAEVVGEPVAEDDVAAEDRRLH
jgi:hypothetical protein